MKSITKEIAELRAMTAHELAEKYKQVFGKSPRVKHKEYLWKRIAWKIQEQRFGGLPGAARRHLNDLMNEIELPSKRKSGADTAKPRASRAPNDPAVGTTLIREYKGRDIRVKVLEKGFEWDGTPYRSLSAVARAVTGSVWSGRLFFNLRKRGKV